MKRDLGPAVPEDVGLSSAALDAVDAVVRQHVDAGTLAGAVTLTARHGKTARVTAMGLKDIAGAVPLAEDTIFRIFSMTKPVTGVAMMILHDEGLWRPEDPISKHLPEFSGLTVLRGGDASGDPVTEPLARAPTMLDLMTHRAGFAYGLPIGEPIDEIDRLYRAARLWEAADLTEFVQRLARLPLAHQPGERWRYSLAMDLQGAVIERLTGRSLPNFYREEIFEPLGMEDTAFHVPPAKKQRLATLYLKMGEVPLTAIANPVRPDHETPPSFALGGAGLFSTAADYARFGQMMLDGGVLEGRRIVSAEGIHQQMTNWLPQHMLDERFTAGHQNFRPGFGYGYNGVVVDDPVAADLPVGKGTYHWDGAAGTWFWVDPENDLVFVGMIQLLSYTPPPLQAVTQRLMAAAICNPGRAPRGHQSQHDAS